MIIRTCKTDEDIRILAYLAEQIWHEYFIDIISKAQIDYMLAKFQSYEAIHKAINKESYTYFLAYEGDVPIGYCGVKPDNERLFLSKLYLHKNSRGNGYASILMKNVIEFAKMLHLNAIYLTCNKYNSHSIDVYERKGFSKIGAVQTDIGRGFIMDDYIMQLDL